jgi:serine protease AprX
LAGIIAGHDNMPTDPVTGKPKPASPNQELGVAPDAHLLAVKLATTDGSTDVSQVIAALDWIVQHSRDNGMNVRVVNLSFGTTALQPYQLDPLAAAAENAWRHGLVVVVSGGNQGAVAGTLTDPAIDPYVIAVGASDQATDFNWDHPRVSSFSSVGTDRRHVDLVAPGRSIAALRDPGSFVDEHNPRGRVDGDTTFRLFRGSGTSQAAAVVSGAAALLLQTDPSLTPDEVKYALVSTTDDMPGFSVAAVGSGELNVKHAWDLVHHGFAAPAQSFPVANGQGSLEAARGGTHLVDPSTGDVLSGEVDVQGNPWDPAAWYAASAAGQAWSGGRWLGARWSGDDWSGARWSSTAWEGARWSGARWSDASWDGARWSGARWSSAGWSSEGWNGLLWSDSGWS